MNEQTNEHKCVNSFANLHLFEVTHCLDWEFAFDGCGGVARLQLNDALGSLAETS